LFDVNLTNKVKESIKRHTNVSSKVYEDTHTIYRIEQQGKKKELRDIALGRKKKGEGDTSTALERFFPRQKEKKKREDIHHIKFIRCLKTPFDVWRLIKKDASRRKQRKRKKEKKLSKRKIRKKRILKKDVSTNSFCSGFFSE
jgi:hypothetical protein